MTNKTLTGLDVKIQEMAGRIRELREITGFTTAEMAERTGISEEEYVRCEAGVSDLHFAFLYRCALPLNSNPSRRYSRNNRQPKDRIKRQRYQEPAT